MQSKSIYVDVNIVDGVYLDTQALRNWRPEYQNAKFLLFNNKFVCETQVEKMSKRLYNTVNPDDLVLKYGADCFRMYEMFLGPLEQAKPWNTAGISGVFGFLKKLWRLYFDENGFIVNDNEPTKDNLKSLHKTIKKVAEDIEGFSFNTSVSQFMIRVNELSTQNCHSLFLISVMSRS